MGKLRFHNSVKPFVKWAGGKGQLLPQLDKCLPVGLENKDFTYVEPFVGGGAMLFHMLQKFPKIGKVVINDIKDFHAGFYIVADESRKREYEDKLHVSMFSPIEKRVHFLDYDRVTKMYEGMTKVYDSIWE